MSSTLWLWVVFNLFVLGALALDLGVFHRQAHVVSKKEAALWMAVWVSLAVLFTLGVWRWQGGHKALEFLTGYLIEQSLSLDNIFVFLLIFSYFRVPPRYQHRVLFWGILGAVIMRGAMIGLGVALLATFHWITYLFGGFLVITGIRFARHEELSVHPEANPVLRGLRRLWPVTKDFHQEHFFIREEGRWFATPLLVVLVMIESTDLVFAVDSIPAVFAITRDPFIVYTSNIFAILGLRALYFLLAGLMPMFRYLGAGLGFVLSFVGVKMLIAQWVKIPILISLGVILAGLVVAIAASLWAARRERAAAPRTP
ncbi:MAG: TerC family protein [Candidatus Acidiferrales bacterium]